MMIKKKLVWTFGFLSLGIAVVWFFKNQPLLAQTFIGQPPSTVTKANTPIVLPVDPNTGELLNGTRAKINFTFPAPKPEDLVKLSPNSLLGGKICYTFNIYKTPPDYNLVVRPLNAGASEGVKTYSITNTDLNALDEPQFSPDGKYVAFKIGDLSGQYPNYHLYVLDLSKDKLVLASKKTFNMPRLSWSPDGKYICLIRGGDAKGLHYHEGESLLNLVSLDWRSGRETIVAKDDKVALGFDWAAPHTLFYTAGSEAANQAKTSESINRPLSSIYSMDVEQGKRELLLDEAFNPVVSPSGKRVAFFGPEISNKSSKNLRRSSKPALSVVQRDGQGRESLNVQSGELPFIAWNQDEKQILTVAGGEDGARGQVLQWNIESGVKKIIGVFKFTTYKENAQELLKPDFLPLRSTIKGMLICRVNCITGANEDFYETQQTMQAMNLQTGEIRVLATGKNGSSFDWNPSD